MVFSSKMLVKNEYTSKLPMNKLLPCSKIYLVNEKKFSMVNLFIITQLSTETKNFALLYTSVSIADSIGLKDGETLTIILNFTQNIQNTRSRSNCFDFLILINTKAT